MRRIEIIANQALEREIQQIIPEKKGKPCFTLIREVDGAGLSGFCLGNDVWPEENILFILYLMDQDIEPFKEKLAQLRLDYPLQGIAAFEIPGVTEID